MLVEQQLICFAVSCPRCRVDYSQGAGDGNLYLSWKYNGSDWKIIPTQYLFTAE